MNSNFEETKQVAFKTLRDMISGDTEIVIDMIDTLLTLQAEDIKNQYDNEQIRLLNQKITDLESKNSTLEAQISELEKFVH